MGLLTSRVNDSGRHHTTAAAHFHPYHAMEPGQPDCD